MEHSKTVYLNTAYQAITGLSPFTLTINPSGISTSNKIYRITYDFGDGTIIDRTINPDNDQDFLNTNETYVYYLTGNIQKNFNVTINAYQFNTSLYNGYTISLDLKTPPIEKTIVNVLSGSAYFDELHLVGTRMFGTENEVLYMFESNNPNYILPVLVNWKARPIETIIKTIDNSYAPYKLLAPFENEFVTSADTGTNIVTFPDVNAAPNPDYGSPSIALYEGDGIATTFLGTVNGDWFNLANWKTDGGNNPLFLPNEYVSVKVYAPLNVSAVNVGKSSIINFYENSLLSQLTVMAAQSAIFNSNSYNIGTIDGDAYFLDNSYNLGYEPTLLLLNGQGVDGSTTFTDSSVYNRILTYTGTPYVTSSPSKYTGKSIYFDGNSTIKPVSGGNDFAFGKGDFTIEAWIYPTRSQYNAQVFYDTRTSNYPPNQPVLYLRSGTAIVYHNGWYDIISGGQVPLNQWSHVAVCRKNNQTRLFLNGVQTGSTVVDNNDYVSTNNRPIIGGSFDNYNFKGFIEDLRVTKGTAKYTGNYTVPASPLTVDPYVTGDVTGTAFFRDNSINYGTLTNTAFSGNCQNLGTVVNADVYYPTPYPFGGTVTGTLTYHGYILGCDDPDASNYDSLANTNDGSCTYSLLPLSGLYAYWTLDEASGTRYDVSGNGFDLTKNGTITSSTGIISNAASFNGSWYNYLTNSSFGITAGSDFTICGWVNLNSTGFQEIISQWYNGWAGNFVITYGENGNNSLGFHALTTNGDKIIYIEAPINEWVFFAMRWKNGVKLEAKINNSVWHVLAGEGSLNGKNWTAFTIGAGESYGYYPTNGLIDEVGVWNRRLNEGEISYLYNSGAGRTYPF